MPDFEKLAAWRHAHRLALSAYGLSKLLPPEERFALADQIRRSAASVPANIAEGYSRCSDTEFSYFIRVALGSAAELQSLALLARDLGYVEHDRLAGFWPQAAQTIRMIRGLHRRVQEDIEVHR